MKKEILQNRILKITLDEQTKTLNIINKKTHTALENLYFNAWLVDPQAKKKNKALIQLNNPDTESSLTFKTWELEPSQGAGQACDIEFAHLPFKMSLLINIVLEDDRDHFIITMTLSNNGDRECLVKKLVPVEISQQRLGQIKLGSKPSNFSFFSNGYQSWTPSRAYSMKERMIIPRFAMARKMSMDPTIKQPKGCGEYYSNMVAGIKDLQSKSGMIIGSLSEKERFTRIHLKLDEQLANLLFLHLSQDGYDIPLKPKQSLSSEPVLVMLTDNPLEGLNRYGKEVNRANEARIVEKPPTTWCSWYYYFNKISQDELAANLDYLEQNKDIASKYDAIQLDDGYQRQVGDWLVCNERFPDGLEPIAKRIDGLGMMPGIWLAPFLIYKGTEIYKEHKQWLLRDKKGRLVKGCINPMWGKRPLYVLDVTYPEASYWLGDIFKTLRQKYGFRYFKLDFLYAITLQGHYFDKSLTPAGALRYGLKVIRDAVGEDAFIEGCGCPLGPAVGLVDAMRIAADTDPHWYNKYNKLVRWESLPSAYNSLRNGLTRFFMNNNLWINHIDCLLLRREKNNLTEEEIRTFMTVTMLSGAQRTHSDRLPDLDKETFEVFDFVNPPLGKAAMPLDLFESDMPTILELPLERFYDEWKTVALFNWEDTAKDMELTGERLGLDGGKQLHVYDLWEKRYLGIRSGMLYKGKLPAHGCKALVVREHEPGKAKLIASNLHYTQGAFEISEFHADDKTIRIRVEKPGKHRARLHLYIPEGYSLKGFNAGSSTVVLEIDEHNSARFAFDFVDKGNLTIELV